MGRSSRRTFIRQMSSATALAMFSGMPDTRLWAASTADFVRDEDYEALLRELANVALDVARSAGAAFADVRMVAGHALALGWGVADYRSSSIPKMGWPGLTSLGSYGIRVIVNGVWGFASDSELTAEAVREATQKAVRRAASNRLPGSRKLELAPVPANERGTWATPIEVDPFNVPIGEMSDTAMAALSEVGRVSGIHRASVSFRWNRNLRVFASTEGALIVQKVTIAVPSAGAAVTWASEAFPGASEGVATLRAGPYGYESVTRANLKEELRLAAERAVLNARRPPSISAEVGRYDLVFSAPQMAALLATTLSEALNLERALGYEANGSGTSFAAPPADILGKYKVASPLLTLRADRNRPGSAGTIGWDDEGVRTSESTLIRDGVIVDYLTNRETGAELTDWYHSRGEPAHSGGFASGTGSSLPSVLLPNLTMAPAQEDVSVEDLIADTKKGFYIESANASPDHQLLNTQCWTNYRDVREIRNGKLGERVHDLAFQFITPSFWAGLDGIGGRSSVVQTLRGTGFYFTDPLQLLYSTMESVPARVREVNVFNYGTNT